MADKRRIAAGFGIATPIVTLGAILLATLVAPPETFTWSDRALSDMGRPDAATFWLFNGGLVVGGLLGVPFVWRLWVGARNTLERAGTVCYGLAIVGMFFVGVFFLEHTAWYLETELHAPAALAFFGLAPVSNWILGAGAVYAGDRTWGLVTVGAGIAHVLTWVIWILYVTTTATRPMAWFAVPEMVAAVLFGGWTVLAARRFLGPSSFAFPSLSS
ncbi:DUF998 domain-containing protein [Natronoglomus mannanivorans]|uniref:DUF998 domain-containing protein n=1 Tax=Natronoglomus mannanivorans TaxID=2979990 RepID=A0AAP3E0H8_9EURY|nr:DUF998 domain-containing protein [Halobacteria archaeon AArc-xg1-1]